MRSFATLALLGLFALQTQDPPPKPPQPPPGAAPLPQVPDVPLSAVERKDLWQRFTPPSPIAGVYRLRAATRGGQAVRGGLQGYLLVGEKHLAIHLQDGTSNPGKPALQSSVREYTLVGSRLQMVCKLGVRLDSGGDPVLEGDGLVEVRAIDITANFLRVVQGVGSSLEFERVE